MLAAILPPGEYKTIQDLEKVGAKGTLLLLLPPPPPLLPPPPPPLPPSLLLLLPSSSDDNDLPEVLSTGTALRYAAHIHC